MNRLNKVALGMNLTSGPFGGGNQFGQTLTRHLAQRGITTTPDLSDNNIDLILVTDPRQWLVSCAFDMRHALDYTSRHPDTPVVLRVNECDERKKNRLKLLNKLISASSLSADHVVFISQYLHSLFTRNNPALPQKSSVIHNGADTSIFNSNGYQHWDGTSPLKIVTHHWSSHYLKGWDIYQLVDDLIGQRWHDKVEFTYIGNAPNDRRLRHTTVLPPRSGHALAAALKHHHVYLTGSQNEPAGMHHIEAASCGLPILYRQSGALPEYCTRFGLPFNGPGDFEQALLAMMHAYPRIANQLPNYPYNAQRMCAQYLALFRNLLDPSQHQPLTQPSWQNHLRLSIATTRLKIATRLPKL